MSVCNGRLKPVKQMKIDSTRGERQLNGHQLFVRCQIDAKWMRRAPIGETDTNGAFCFPDNLKIFPNKTCFLQASTLKFSGRNGLNFSSFARPKTPLVSAWRKVRYCPKCSRAGDVARLSWSADRAHPNSAQSKHRLFAGLNRTSTQGVADSY